jgi:hypothetical protein
MLKYQTATEYRAMLRDLSTADLLTLSESHVNNQAYQDLDRCRSRTSYCQLGDSVCLNFE